MLNNKLRDIQLCEVEILKEFIKICNKKNLSYYIGGGTLLGAVRHKGFIPWDDDIDIYMPRKDYEIFLSSINDEISSNYKVYNFSKNKDYFYYQTIMVDEKYKFKLNHTKGKISKSSWIDIWPLDQMPKNKFLFLIRKYKILYRRFRYQATVFDMTFDIKKKRNLIEKILIFMVDKIGLGKKSNSYKMLFKLDKTLKKKVKKPYYYVNGMSVYKFKNLMPIHIYGKGNLYEFENIKVNGPFDYNYFLTKLYGDYMTPISEKGSSSHDLEFVEKEKKSDA